MIQDTYLVIHLYINFVLTKIAYSVVRINFVNWLWQHQSFFLYIEKREFLILYFSLLLVDSINALLHRIGIAIAAFLGAFFFGAAGRPSSSSCYTVIFSLVCVLVFFPGVGPCFFGCTAEGDIFVAAPLSQSRWWP